MKPFEFLEHTADLKIRAYGATKEEAFLNMALGMQESRKPVFDKSQPIMRKIEIESSDLSSLLVDFLSEVNYFNDAEDEAYEEGVVKIKENKKLSAQLRGYKVRKFEDDIKAVTYHDLDIQKKGDIWELTVLFDI